MGTSTVQSRQPLGVKFEFFSTKNIVCPILMLELNWMENQAGTKNPNTYNSQK